MNNNRGYSRTIMTEIAKRAHGKLLVNVNERRPAKVTIADTIDGARLLIQAHKAIDERAEELYEVAHRILVDELHCWTLWRAFQSHKWDIARDDSETSKVLADLKFTEAGSSQAFESVCYALTGDCSDYLWAGWLRLGN